MKQQKKPKKGMPNEKPRQTRKSRSWLLTLRQNGNSKTKHSDNKHFSVLLLGEKKNHPSPANRNDATIHWHYKRASNIASSAPAAMLSVPAPVAGPGTWAAGVLLLGGCVTTCQPRQRVSQLAVAARLLCPQFQDA